EVGFGHTAISRWERGLQIPNIDTLIVFAKYFKVSCDYLVGLEDY
ncbi:MAG: helix-turn-helix transcriptional regulator, partial [Clostridia bacterium]|nr:helix-turn-helix transcriptional regulator [Clostridia bacterium]